MEASSSSSHCSSSVTSPPPPPPPPPPLFNADLDKAPILVPSNPPTSTTSANPSDQIHVLAVDDSILDRKVIEKLLRTSSYKVTTVDSGSKALEFLGIEGDGGTMQIHVKVGLIITDYCMPGMTGYDLLKRVKETSALKDIPIVIMSSENVPTRIQRCLDEGAKEFIMKPVQMADVERLKAHVRPLLSSPLALSPSSSMAYRVDVDHQTSSVSACNKRKFDPEGFEPSQSSSERRPPRPLSGVIVA